MKIILDESVPQNLRLLPVLVLQRVDTVPLSYNEADKLTFCCVS
jgi:hypothetical protein